MRFAVNTVSRFSLAVLLIILAGPPPAAPAEDLVKLSVAFGGDALFGGYYSPHTDFGIQEELNRIIDRSIAEYGYHEGITRFVDHTLFYIQPILDRAEYTVVNLEGPITGATDYIVKYFPLKQHPRTPDILREAGIKLVSLANNHTYDFGKELGLEDTIRHLRKAGISYTGAGMGDHSFDDAFGYTLKKSPGLTLAYFGVTDILDPAEMIARDGKTGVAGLPVLEQYRESTHLHHLLENIRQARKEADFIIVLLHAGPWKGIEPNDRQHEIIDLLLTEKIDVVICSHSHVQQPVKKVLYDSRLVQIAYYGMGNFIFGGQRSDQMPGLIALITFHKENGTKYLSVEDYPILPNRNATFQPIIFFPDEDEKNPAPGGNTGEPTDG